MPRYSRLPFLFLLLLTIAPTYLAAAVVREVRIARHEGFARIVIELDRQTGFRYRNASLSEKTVSIELSGVTAGPGTANAIGVVPAIEESRVDFQSSRSLYYIHLKTSGGVRVEKQQLENPARIVFDLYADGAAAPAIASPPASVPAVEAAPEPAGNSAPTSGIAPASTGGIRKRVIVVDPGHGGRHRGGVGTVRGKRVEEAEVTLPIAFELEKLLKNDPMFEPKLTRRTDVYVGLRERTKRAEQFAGDLFLSIHYNAVPASSSKSSARGLEFYTWSPRNSDSVGDKYLLDLENEEGDGSVLSDTNADAREVLSQLMVDSLEEQALESRVVAQKFEKAFLRDSYFKTHYRGLKSGRFKVLENYNMPSVLVEVLFISHPEEARKSVDPAFQRSVARYMYEGIVAYYEANDPQFRAERNRALALK